MALNIDEIYQADLATVKSGADHTVLVRRKREIDGFEDERMRCRNPYRKMVIDDELKRLKREFSELQSIDLGLSK